jgi:hypothetical protein
MKMKRLLWSFGIASILFNVNAAENLLKSGDGEDAELAGKWGQGTIQNTTDKKSGFACMENSFAARNFTFAPELIEVDPAKTYKLSGFFKSRDKDKKSKAMCCIRYYNSDKKEIEPWSVLPVADTATTLTADAKKGEKILKIAPKEWIRHKAMLYAVAFNAKDDLSDLPNFNTSPIADVSVKETFNEITLGEPLTQDYPAGTKVRMHRYLDYMSIVNEVPAEWTEYSISISGEAEGGAPAKNKFWNGTKFIKVSIFGMNVAPLLFDDIAFQEVMQK